MTIELLTQFREFFEERKVPNNSTGMRIESGDEYVLDIV